MSAQFLFAKPIWESGTEEEMNRFVAFTATAPRTASVLRLTACTIYTCFINGQFAFQGPARGPKGYFRVDEMDLTPYLTREENHIDIEVGGYNCTSYCYNKQPSFLQAEICCGNEMIAATGVRGFSAVPMLEKVQKVQRYSFQRVFTEAYRLDAHSMSFRTRMPDAADCVPVSVQPEKALLPRGVLFSEYPRLDVQRKISQGTFEIVPAASHWIDRSLTDISPILSGFPEEELDFIVSYETEDMKCRFEDCAPTPYTGDDFPDGTAAIYEFPHNASGLLACRITCRTPASVYLAFDELLTDGDIEFSRASGAAIVKYILQPGKYDLITCEPYVMKYVKVMVSGGDCRVENLHIRQLVCPGVHKVPHTQNESLKKIYAAACETFRQNAVDIFMDCPSRERAGWLCDSFWTGRVERQLTGANRIERNFLENFLLPAHFDALPDGMFPMCYPADHLDGNFIPNWAMWLVLELEEYLQRTGDRELVDRFRSKMYALLHYFDPFVNSDGLLEKLDAWVFVEWSASNDFVQDVNYPTNMLFAGMLDALGRLYGDDALFERAAAIRAAVRRQSFNGKFFTDNAVRRGGELVNEGHMTESCQYYAFFTETATPELYPELWKTLCTEFGPQRKETHAHPEVDYANAFVGNYLRLECLWRQGLHDQLLKEVEGYFLKMADLTGTLWEHDDISASCDHGFASHVAVWIGKILGD